MILEHHEVVVITEISWDDSNDQSVAIDGYKNLIIEMKNDRLNSCCAASSNVCICSETVLQSRNISNFNIYSYACVQNQY